MQNFFLSRSLGREGQCHDADAALLKHALPAARSPSIQVIWPTGVLTENDLESMSPTSLQIFKFDDNVNSLEVPALGEELKQAEKWTDVGMGAPLGELMLTDGTKIDMGRMMMRDQWTTALHEPLRDEFDASLDTELPDLRFHKNRISGVCDSSTDLSVFLSDKGKDIKTLLFAGINIDQCVLGMVQYANLKGWDTVLLKDGSGTDNPKYASQMSIDNCGKSWGFLSTCEQPKYGMERMSKL